MKLRTAIMVSTVLAGFCFQSQARAATSCPLFEIVNYPNGALYFCDQFLGACGVDPQAAYLFGSYAIPYQNCPGDCVSDGDPLAVSSKSSPTEEDVKRNSFQGLKSYVRPDYMHTGKIPDGVAQQQTRINEQRNNHFTKLVIGNKIVFAKLLEFQVLRPDVNGKDRWTSRFVAFEVEKDPALAGGTVSKTYALEKFDTDGFIYRARVSFGLERATEALILLHKSIR